ncbi:hypothetical protein [Arthrobacter sp. FW305-BF8]|nr:hypothetical protein [Arthrobacter sp. FW305-BF8]
MARDDGSADREAEDSGWGSRGSDEAADTIRLQLTVRELLL